MPELRITQRDIDNLARKLDEFGEVLGDHERAVLVAVFGLAGTALGEAAGAQTEAAGPEFESGVREFTSFEDARVDMPTTVPRLSDGFRNAFSATRPGNFTFARAGGEVEAISVGGETITWTAE